MSRSVSIAAGFLVVAADMVLASPLVRSGYGARALLAAVLCILTVRLVSGGDSLPAWGGSWRDARASLRWVGRFLAVAIPLLVLLAGGYILAVRLSGRAVPIGPLVAATPSEARAFLLHGIVAAPLVEELIYRGIVLPRLRTGGGARFALAVSGPIFWVLHWVDRGGITPPHHLLAGWILAWAYLRTRSLLAPTLLHALGNLGLLVIDVSRMEWPWMFSALESR